jgi:hypothetical protein
MISGVTTRLIFRRNVSSDEGDLSRLMADEANTSSEGIELPASEERWNWAWRDE